MLEGSHDAGSKEGMSKHDFLTPFEMVLLGGSRRVFANGEEVLIGSSNLRYLMQNPEVRRVILSPINVTEGKKTLEEVSEKRKQMEFSTFILTLFEYEPWSEYLCQGIRFSLRPGELDDAGQLTGFKLYPLQKGQRIKLSQIRREDIVVNEDFKPVVNFLGEENGAWRFRIKSIKEIKHELALKPQKHGIGTKTQ